MQSSDGIRTHRGQWLPPAGSGRWAVGVLVLACGLWSLNVLPVRAQQDVPQWKVLSWHGVDALSESELRRVLSLPLPHDELASALGRVAQAYSAAGYLDTRLRAESQGDTLSVFVEEGEPARVQNLFLRGTRSLTESEARSLIGVRVGQRYRGSVLEAGLQKLLHEYAARGHLYANAVIERVEIEPGGVTIGIVVTEGDVATLREVEVLGNDHSRSQLVERIAGLRTQRPADMAAIEDATHLLRRSGLFGAVEEPLLYRAGTMPTDVGVLLRVEEMQRRNTVFGSIGVARNPLTGSAYVNGAVDLQLRNIWGTGRDLDVAWKRDALRGSNLLLGYRERFLFGSPFDLEASLGQTVRDSTYTYQTLSLGLQLPVRQSLSLHLGTAIDRSVFHTGIQGNSRRLRQRIGLRFESAGREVDGGTFGALGVHLEYAQKSNDLVTGGIEDHAKVRQTVWRGDFDAGFPLGRHQVIGARGQWFWIDSNEAEVPESELFWYGGARTLRGYREDQFRGDQVLLVSLEYRIGDPRTGRLYGFVDAGGHRRKRAVEPVSEQVQIGYGLGLRAAMPSGLFDLAFGIGEERSFSEIKVHVSLQQRF